MKIKRIGHLGIAVADLQETARLYAEVFGLKVSHEETVAGQKVRTGFIQVGESRIELLESTAPDGPIARHIEKRGPGLQHVALEVENIDDAIAHVRSKDVRTLTDSWSIGAGGSKVIFLHPKDTGGVLVEFVESKK